MYHSIDIIRTDSSGIQINTWEDWHLIPTSRPTFSMPKRKERTIDIPGRDGILDLTDAFGSTVFQNREGSFEFVVADEYTNDIPAWNYLYSEIANKIHGRTVKLILEDDPSYFYKGCITLNEWRSDPKYSLVVFDYSVDPYKYSFVSSLDDWPWDPFDFISGVIREYRDIYIDSSADAGKRVWKILTFDWRDPYVQYMENDRFMVVGGRRFTAPNIHYEDANNLVIRIYEQNTLLYTISTLSGTGDLLIPDFFFEDKEYNLRFTGSGTISIDFTEGSL